MGTATVYCFPAPGSQHHVHLDQSNKFVTLYLRAVSWRSQGRLECWTNLPTSDTIVEDGEEDWHAIDIAHLSEDEKDQSLVKAVQVNVTVIQGLFKKGKSIDFSFAWRLALDDDNEQPVIKWLTSPGCDGMISFHLDQQDSLQSLIDDLHVIEGADVVKKGEDMALILIHRDIELETAKKQSIRLLHPSRIITGGAVWERTKSTWFTSRSVTEISDISEQYLASMIVLQYSDVDKVIVILPVCTSSANVSLFQKEGAIFASLDQFKQPMNSEYRVVIAVGPIGELHSLIQKCFQQIKSEAQKQTLTIPLKSPLLGTNGLGFCTWEALGAGKERPGLSNLIAVLERVEKRAAASIAALLIDDGWQYISTDDLGKRRLKSFDLDPNLVEDDEKSVDQMESRLGKYVQQLRNRFPQIKTIAVWMTLGGYWDGLNPADFSTRYGPLVEAKLSNPFLANEVYSWWLPSFSRLESYYSDYFLFLRQAGISFVKVDDQADWEWIQKLDLSSAESDITPSIYYDYAWKAMTCAAKRFFGDMCVINSMSFGHRFITHQTTDLSGPHLVRNSDDTFPNVPQSHIWHIYHNSLNACLINGNRNLLPDADMITSSMLSESSDIDWADYHAAFRACFSASTIWLSDGVDVSDKGSDRVLNHLLAPSKDVKATSSLGRLNTIQVTSKSNSLPLIESVFANLTDDTKGPALKLAVEWSCRSDQFSGVILSAWNTRYHSKSIDWITTSDIYQAFSDDNKLGTSPLFIFSSSSFNRKIGLFLPPISQEDFKIYKSQSIMTSKPLIPFTLHPGQYCIFSVVSALPLTQDEHITCLGLIDKYNGFMAVKDLEKLQDGVGISASLSRAGKCAFLVQGIIQRWTAKIDGIDVHKNCIDLEFVQECTLIIIDMIKHLKETSAFEKQNIEFWKVDLLKPQ